MSDIFEQMEADFEQKLASSVEKLDQGDLTTVAGMARAIRDKESVVADLEAKLKEEKKALLKMTDEELPTMLAEIGLSSMKLDDGSEVTVKPTYGASILVDNRPAAYKWLREHGYDDIIKIPSLVLLVEAKTRRRKTSKNLLKKTSILSSKMKKSNRPHSVLL
jgi:hypothetical protein